MNEKTEETALTAAEQNLPTSYNAGVVHGFEDTHDNDIIIPRLKVIQALSPERQEGEAVEGDIINSLTKESMKGQKFIPVKQYYSNICWNPDRKAETRMLCRSFDGHIGQDDDGSVACEQCKKNKFDNTKKGRDAQPQCTAYLNFLGFFEGDPMPVVLSFARTNYNEGRKLLSIAKSLRCDAWNYGYTLEAKKVTKDGNMWYIIVPRMAGDTAASDRAIALEMYKAYHSITVQTDYEDAASESAGATDPSIEAEM